ncbi:MAG: hypothetical protein LAT54_03545 [Cryomorphaceae bacterium]|nr:hypothetical protein [Cryomorphaceae bacterium]
MSVQSIIYRLMIIPLIFVMNGCGDDGGKLTEFSFELQDATNRAPLEGVYASLYQGYGYEFFENVQYAPFISNANGELSGHFFTDEGTTSQIIIGALNSNDCYPTFTLLEGRITEDLLRLKRPTVELRFDFSDYAQGAGEKDLNLRLTHDASLSCSRALIYQERVNVADEQVLSIMIYPMGTYSFKMSGMGLFRMITFDPQPNDTLIEFAIDQ